MDATREAEELVRLWQDLQSAQVAGDARRLAGLASYAAARAEQPGASPEWAQLAREAGRNTERLMEQAEAQPTAGVGEETGEAVYELEEILAPDAAREPAEEGASTGSGRRRGVGQLLWVVLILGYLLLQVIGNLGDGGGP